MNSKIEIPEYAAEVLSLLNSHGYEAFAVGGCVRDSIMNKTPYDWDITTSAKPEETLKVFEKYKTIETGIKHGTVTVIINHCPVEITTYRIDGNYSDNRHPDKVSFTRNLENDLARRDFTVNALAYSPNEGIIDLNGGIEDINKKIIRTVGNPDKRFGEDALRIMRGLRFASVLDFKIEKETSVSIHRNKKLLQNIAVERISSELNKLILGENVLNILTDYKDIIFTVIPELEATDCVEQNCPYHIYDVWNHIAHSVASVKPDRILRLAMLFHDIEKPLKKTTDENGRDHFKCHAPASADTAKAVLKKMHYDNKTINCVFELIKHHDDRLYVNPEKIKKYASKYGIDFLRLLNEVSKADILAQTPEMYDRLELCKNFDKAIDSVEKEKCCLSVADLNINGNDIISIGISGSDIGKTLLKLLDMVISGKIENKKDTLINAAADLTNHL